MGFVLARDFVNKAANIREICGRCALRFMDEDLQKSNGDLFFFDMKQLSIHPSNRRFWEVTNGADPRAFKLYLKHYSKNKFRKSFGTKFTGPGEHLVLVLPDYRALFVWCLNTTSRRDRQSGILCTIFRNESDILSSQLILAAEEFAWERWPERRLWTYVDSSKIRSPNPGFCFKKAGWSECGISKIHKLLIFEKFPYRWRQCHEKTS